MRLLLSYWDRLRTGFWFIPALLAAGAVVLSSLALWADTWIDGTAVGKVLRDWSGGPEGAREMLGTVAGSMITIAGVTFSIVVVALVLASNQFTPRVLRNFMRDRGNQWVIGSFVATFLYALLVLRGVRSDGDGLAYVPSLSVLLAVALAVVNLGVYIYFIHHIADSMRIDRITERIARETHEEIDRVFRHAARRPVISSGAPESVKGRKPSGVPLRSHQDGYVESIDPQRLLDLCQEQDVRLALAVGIGEFVARGAALAWVEPAPDQVTHEELEHEVRGAFLLGAGRSLTQDPGFGFQQIVDVAVKALSPGINDPSTAATCIDYLGSLLRDLVRRPEWLPDELTDGEGRPRVRLRQATFEDYLDLATFEIAVYGRSDAGTMLRLFGLLEEVEEEAEHEERRAALARSFETMAGLAAEKLRTPVERQRLVPILRRLGDGLGIRPERLTAAGWGEAGPAPPAGFAG